MSVLDPLSSFWYSDIRGICAVMSRQFKFAVVASSTCLVALLLFGAVYARSASTDGPYNQLGVYTEVLERIKADYVEEPDMKAVTLGAINGLLESLDPYASYLNADQYKQYLKEKDVPKADVGLILSKRFGYLGIIDSIPGSPAAKAGLVTGTVVESINNVSSRDMPLAFAGILLKGEAGTTVDVSVLRPGKSEAQKVTLTRAQIAYPAVMARMLPDQIGLIQVETLVDNRVDEVAAKVKELEKQGAKRLILDLRHCATGSPEAGIELANLFEDKGLITYSLGQRMSRQNHDAQASKAITKLPLAVITDRATAGGSEIAAAALEGTRAQVVGERTYGDAAIRKPVTLDDGSAIILSVAKFYSPDGKAIQDNGVTPTVTQLEPEATTDLDDDSAASPAVPAAKPGEDLLLEKAIDTLKNHPVARNHVPRPAGSLRRAG